MEEQQVDKKYARFVLALFAMIIVAVMYVEGMLTPSLPSIAEGFHITVDQVSLVLSTYLLTGVALSPVVGKLADLYGKKKMMSIVMLLYAGAVSVTGFSPNFTFMVVSRAVQGIGLTIMPLGSFISDYYGWRMTYHTAIPFIVALAILTIWKVRESKYRRPDVKVDYVGAAALGIPLALIVLAMSEGSSWGWHSVLFLSILIVGVILLIPMFIYEKHYYQKGGEAIFDMKLLSKRNVLIANIALTVSGLGMYLSMQALSYKFETPTPYGFGFSILETGISMVAFAAGMIVFSIVTGKLISRTGIKPLAIAGSFVTAIGFFLLSTSPGLAMTLIDEVIIGSGMAIMNASIINLLVLSVEARDMGLATSMNSTFRYIGSSIGAPIAGTVLSLYTVVDIVHTAAGTVIFSFPDYTAFRYAFIIGSLTFIIAAFIVIMSNEVLGRRTVETHAKKTAAAEN